LSAAIGFDDDAMAYNAMTVGPVNDKARNRWESWIVWGVVGPEVAEANVPSRQTPAGEINKARDAREMKTIHGNRAVKTKRNEAEDMTQGDWAMNDTMRGGIGQRGAIRRCRSKYLMVGMVLPWRGAFRLHGWEPDNNDGVEKIQQSNNTSKRR
jgi:hypothetical protein